jgi:GT2 family glycosyltransferase
VSPSLVSSEPQGVGELPLVSVVFLAHNRKDELRESVRRMLDESGYPSDRLKLIVVDNASADGTAEMIRKQYPAVTLVETGANLGAPGWNAGFEIARGEYVLILDDDAYLPPGALEDAVRAAQEQDAGLVSFTIVSSYDEHYRFNDRYRTGLLSYWGCAALVSRAALDQVGGYDPNIFIWGNELDFTMRLLDKGFTHLHLPEVVAMHMKEPIVDPVWEPRGLRYNCHHWGYVAGKLMRPYDAALAVTSLALWTVVEAVARDWTMLRGFVPVFTGFVAGVRHRDPVRRVVSSTYRRNFHTFGWPWRYWRSPAERWRARRGGESAEAQRDRSHSAYFDERQRLYPEGRASLRL